MNQYFEQMVLAASPVELIRLLYQRAIASVREAREHLKNGRIMERGRSISNAYLVLVELAKSLDAEQAPELAKRLGGLYAYMQQRLLEANLRQQDAPLADVLSVLSTLAEAWKAVPDSAAEPAPAAMAQQAKKNPWAGARMDDEPVRLALSA